MAEPLTLRPALPSPTAAAAPAAARHVRLRHPGYPHTTNILFVLPALDHPDGGIHHETARLACAIVAGNRWDGYLAQSAAVGAPPVDAAADAVLRARDYYFCVPGLAQYPVVPSFRTWQFPHDALPDIWAAACPPSTAAVVSSSSSALSTVLHARDRSCRISACQEACEVAHICLHAENAWFHANGMQLYNRQTRRVGATAIDDMANAILLRADLHYSYDRKKFVFVPKRPAPDASPSLVVHVLDPLALELRHLYHNVALQELGAVSIELLFARFAYSIFPLLEGSLQYGVDRELLLPADDGTLTVKSASGADCHLMTQPRRSSSSSGAKKRARSPAPNEREGREEEDGDAKRLCRVGSVGVDSFVSAPSLSSGDNAFSDPLSPAPRSNPVVTTALQPLPDAAVAADEEQRRLDRLRDKHLAEERQRSDPDSTWAARSEWTRRARNRPHSPRSLARVLEYIGVEIPD